MKIRHVYAKKELKTKSVKLKIFGGEKDCCNSCLGYYAGGARLSPARKMCVHNPDAVLKNLANVLYFENINAGVAFATTGQVYRWTNATSGLPFTFAGLVSNYYHSAFPCYYDGGSAVAVISGPRLALVTADKYAVKQLPHQIKGACYHMGRIFAVDVKADYTVRWSGTAFSEWKATDEDAGYINLPPDRGKLHRVIAFGDRLIVYREHGLDIIKAFGDPQYYSVVHQGGKNFTEKLYEDACAVCGGKIYFCSYDKIYCYDGQEITQVKLPEYMKATGYSLGKSFDGMFVCFYCKADADGKYYQFELDTLKGACAFFAPDTKFIWKDDDGVYAWKDNVVYREDINGSDMPSVWRSEKFDVGTAGVKTLKKVHFDKSGEACVKVTADGLSRTIEDSGETSVGLSGRQFEFEIFGCGKANSLDAEWEIRV